MTVKLSVSLTHPITERVRESTAHFPQAAAPTLRQREALWGRAVSGADVCMSGARLALLSIKY